VLKGIVVQTPEQFCSLHRRPTLTQEEYTILLNAGLSAPIDIDLNQTPEENEMTLEENLSA